MKKVVKDEIANKKFLILYIRINIDIQEEVLYLIKLIKK
jgi:hypothetical protein